MTNKDTLNLYSIKVRHNEFVLKMGLILNGMLKIVSNKVVFELFE